MLSENWYAQGDCFEYQGHSIFYIDSKTTDSDPRPTIILIHGFPTCSWDWAKVWPTLSKEYRLVTLDLLGFGHSSKPVIDYSIGLQADIIEALLAKLGLQEYAIVAHDYGDTVAQELLARPKVNKQVWACVLSNGGLFPETHRPLFIQKLLLSPLGGYVAKLMKFKKFKRSLDNICTVNIANEELLEYWRLLTQNNGKRVFARLINYMKEREQNRTRWVSALQDFDKPLLLINGLDDPISGRHMVERFYRLVPNGEVEQSQGVGHYPQVESPQWFADCVLSFCHGKHRD